MGYQSYLLRKRTGASGFVLITKCSIKTCLWIYTPYHISMSYLVGYKGTSTSLGQIYMIDNFTSS